MLGTILVQFRQATHVQHTYTEKKLKSGNIKLHILRLLLKSKLFPTYKLNRYGLGIHIIYNLKIRKSIHLAFGQIVQY